jgi:hypothetical protein
VVGRLFDRIGPRPLALTGVVLLTLTTFTFHNLNIATATGTVMFWIMLRGFVMPLANMPAQTAAMVDIPTELIGRASAVTNIIGRVSGSFGIAVLTSVLTARQAFHGSFLAWTVNPASRAATGALARAAALLGGGADGTARALATINGMVAKASYVSAMDDVFILSALIAALAFVPAFFLKKGEARRVQAAAE